MNHKNLVLEQNVFSIVMEFILKSLIIHSLPTEKERNKWVRGTEKTKLLNEMCLNIIAPICDKDKTLCKYEEEVKDSDGETIRIDAILDQDHAILAKSISTSFNKNKENYLGNVLNDLYRVYAFNVNEIKDTTFVNVVPYYVPEFNSEGDIKKWETVKYSSEEYINRFQLFSNQLSQKNGKINLINIRYDLSNRLQMKKRSDFSGLKEFDVTNLTIELWEA